MAKIEFEKNGSGEFLPTCSASSSFDGASAFANSEGLFTLCTGDDGFGLVLDDEDFEQFIEFLREVKRRVSGRP